MRQCDTIRQTRLGPGDPIREMVCKSVLWVWRFKPGQSVSALQKFHLRNELRKTEFRLGYNCVFADTGTRDHGRFEVQVKENSADGNRTIKWNTPKRQVFQEQAFDR
jgi:hypothetical protein